MALPLVAAGVGLAASALSSRGAGRSAARKRADAQRYVNEVRAANTRYRGQRVEGYTTNADETAAERTRTRGTASASRSAQLARTQANRSIAARGLSGAAAAALHRGADEIEGEGREAAYMTAADQLKGAFDANRAFETNKLMTAWGAETGALANQAGINQQAIADDDARTAELWNSVLQMAPVIQSAWSAVPTTAAQAAQRAATGAATYNPAVSTIRQPVRR